MREKIVYLVYPRSRDLEFTTPIAPFLIIFLGSYLKQNGYQPKLFDRRINTLDEIIDNYKIDKPLLIGYSVMTGPQIKYAYYDCQYIKNIFNDAIILWGGVHSTFFPEQTLKERCIDLIITGEGEEALLELCNVISEDKKNFKNYKVANLVYKDNEKIIVNPERKRIENIDIIDLDWSLIDINRYITGDKKIEFITSRGCPYSCAFCYNQLFNKRRWRGWSLDKTKYELQKVIDKGVRKIVFQDDNISTDIKRWLGIIKYLGEQKIKWKAEIRADFPFTKEIIKYMEDNGAEIIFIGAESGSQRILDLIRKDIKVSDILKFAELLQETNIIGRFSWIVGFPTETREEMLQTIKLIKQIKKILPNSLHFVKVYTPYPGSELYNIAVEKGFKQPQNLLGWADFTRENIKSDYIKNIYEIKGIVYATFFGLTTPESNDVRGIFKIFYNILGIFGRLRLKFMFFKIPLEFLTIEFYQKLLNWFKNKCM